MSIPQHILRDSRIAGHLWLHFFLSCTSLSWCVYDRWASTLMSSVSFVTPESAGKFFLSSRAAPTEYLMKFTYLLTAADWQQAISTEVTDKTNNRSWGDEAGISKEWVQPSEKNDYRRPKYFIISKECNILLPITLAAWDLSYWRTFTFKIFQFDGTHLANCSWLSGTWREAKGNFSPL